MTGSSDCSLAGLVRTFRSQCCRVHCSLDQCYIHRLYEHWGFGAPQPSPEVSADATPDLSPHRAQRCTHGRACVTLGGAVEQALAAIPRLTIPLGEWRPCSKMVRFIPAIYFGCSTSSQATVA